MPNQPWVDHYETLQLSPSADRETLERFRAMPPRQAFEAAKSAVYGAGDVGSPARRIAMFGPSHGA